VMVRSEELVRKYVNCLLWTVGLTPYPSTIRISSGPIYSQDVRVLVWNSRV